MWKRIIKIGSIVIAPGNKMSEVQGFERETGEKFRTVIVRVLRTGEILRLKDADLDFPRE